MFSMCIHVYLKCCVFFLFFRLRLFENAAESPMMQTTSVDNWDEIEAVITPYGKDKQETDSEAPLSVSSPLRFC